MRHRRLGMGAWVLRRLLRGGCLDLLFPWPWLAWMLAGTVEGPLLETLRAARVRTRPGPVCGEVCPLDGDLHGGEAWRYAW